MGLILSREAAKECSPRRKAWVGQRKITSPEGAKENPSPIYFAPSGLVQIFLFPTHGLRRFAAGALMHSAGLAELEAGGFHDFSEK
jgi:hypothetical protein